MNRPPRHWINGSAALAAIFMMAVSIAWCSRSAPSGHSLSIETISPEANSGDASADDTSAADTDSMNLPDSHHQSDPKTHKGPTKSVPQRNPLDDVL